MKKIGILLFVIVLFFSCQKSQDAEFEKYMEELKKENHLVFLPKKDDDSFDVFETLV
jgi:Tfp pilus assembly protein PilP